MTLKLSASALMGRCGRGGASCSSTALRRRRRGDRGGRARRDPQGEDAPAAAERLRRRRGAGPLRGPRQRGREHRAMLTSHARPDTVLVDRGVGVAASRSSRARSSGSSALSASPRHRLAVWRWWSAAWRVPARSLRRSGSQARMRISPWAVGGRDRRRTTPVLGQLTGDLERSTCLRRAPKTITPSIASAINKPPGAAASATNASASLWLRQACATLRICGNAARSALSACA